MSIIRALFSVLLLFAISQSKLSYLYCQDTVQVVFTEPKEEKFIFYGDSASYKIDWHPIANAQFYIVQYWLTQDSLDFPSLKSDTVNDTTFDLQGLKENYDYSYRVGYLTQTLRDTIGWSAENSITPIRDKPAILGIISFLKEKFIFIWIFCKASWKMDWVVGWGVSLVLFGFLFRGSQNYFSIKKFLEETRESIASEKGKKTNVALKNEITQLEKKVSASIKKVQFWADIAPFLGLLGTVAGLLMAFYGIVQTIEQSGDSFPKASEILSEMASGLFSAINTTILGLLTHILLSFENRRLQNKFDAIHDIINQSNN